MFDYTESTDPKVIPVHTDDILEVLVQDSSGWWLCASPDDGRKGYVPRNYLELVDIDGMRAL